MKEIRNNRISRYNLGKLARVWCLEASTPAPMKIVPHRLWFFPPPLDFAPASSINITTMTNHFARLFTYPSPPGQTLTPHTSPSTHQQTPFRLYLLQEPEHE